MNDDSRRQDVFEPRGEAGSVIEAPGAPAPLVPVPLSRRSIAISIVSAAIALAYVLSPIDLVPEALVPVVGFVDDLLVLIGGVVLVRAVLVAALSERDRRRQELREYEETEYLVGKWSP
jgi:hypothetical protein